MIKSKILILFFVVFIILCQCKNIYAEQENDTKISIMPWPKSAFTDAPDLNSILVQGSWIGDEGGNFIYEKIPQINTSEIFCDKNANKCVEARAEVSPWSGFLTAKSFEYQVTKWVDNEVEAYQTSAPYNALGHSFGAGKLILHIDRVNKITTLKGEYEIDGQKGIWKAHLDSGEELMKLYKNKKS